MFIGDGFTEADALRAHALGTPSPENIAGASVAALKAIDIFMVEYVLPAAQKTLAGSPDNVVVAFFYRSIGFLRSVQLLPAATHFQSIVSAERSIVELYVDMELAHRGVIPDAKQKV